MLKVITKDEFNRSVEVPIYSTTDFKSESIGSVSPVKTNAQGKIDRTFLVLNIVGDISPGITQVLDVIPIEDFTSQEYDISVRSEDFTEMKSLKVLAARTGESSVGDSVYAVIGTADIEVSAIFDDGDFVLNLKNNTDKTLSYSVNKTI